MSLVVEVFCSCKFWGARWPLFWFYISWGQTGKASEFLLGVYSSSLPLPFTLKLCLSYKYTSIIYFSISSMFVARTRKTCDCTEWLDSLFLLCSISLASVSQCNYTTIHLFLVIQLIRVEMWEPYFTFQNSSPCSICLLLNVHRRISVNLFNWLIKCSYFGNNCYLVTKIWSLCF